MKELLPTKKLSIEYGGINLVVDNSGSSYSLNSDEVDNILVTMQYLADNYNVLKNDDKNDDIQCYNTDLDNIKSIECDTASAVDEFYIVDSNNNSISIEVVTAEVAERNDRDFLRDDEQLNDYKLGKTWSYYTPLNGTEYYYRLL